MLSGPSYKPNKVRGLLLLTFAVLLTSLLATHRNDITVSGATIMYLFSTERIYFKESISKPFIFKPTPSPPIRLNWKTEPSTHPVPSPTAFFLTYKGITATPATTISLHMEATVRIQDSIASITLTLYDENENPIQYGYGTLSSTNNHIVQLPETGAKGSASFIVPVQKGMTYTIKETFRGLTVSDAFHT